MSGELEKNDDCRRPIQETSEADNVPGSSNQLGGDDCGCAVDDQHRTKTPHAWFTALMALVARWYTETARMNINKVKVLLKDILEEHELKLIKNFSELFEKLHLAGKLHPTKLELLYEIVNSTGQIGLEWGIREIVKSCPNIKDIEIIQISKYRLKLIRFGNALDERDWNAIDRACNFPRKQYSDAWSMIIDLENQEKISENLGSFIELLEQQTILNHAVAALRK